jgi:phospholipid/cholesterol/gamma-HCH transport system substrate-binding protein
MPRRTRQDLRVGIFVALGLGLLIATVFTIGRQESLFMPRTELYTAFDDVNGLVVGAPVRLAGVDVGRVTEVAFPDDLARAEARVRLSIEDRYMPRVRSDSRAYIDSKGLLGDKIINLSPGTPRGTPLREGDYVEARPGVSIEALAEQVESTATAIGDAADEARGAVQEIASPEVAENLRRITASLAAILEQVERGDGLAHRLLYDRNYERKAASALDDLADMSRSARSAARRGDELLARLDRQGGALDEWRRAGAGVAQFTDTLNYGDGLVQALTRDEAGRALVRDLAAFSQRLDRLSADVERGRGTLGGLIVDPSVYEEMKTVLGNIERNVILKALIRMTIKEEGLARPPRQAVPAPVSEQARPLP